MADSVIVASAMSVPRSSRPALGPFAYRTYVRILRTVATYALAGKPSLSDARPATGIAAQGPRPRPAPGPLPAERILPVLPELAGLFPGGGLPRGGTVLLGPAEVPDTLLSPALGTSGPSSAGANRTPGLTSLLLLLLAGTSSLGYWCAVAGLPELGLAAAAELGADLDRLVIVPHPGAEGRWQSVVATLLETVDLVCLAPDTPVRPVDARRLAARARERCSTLARTRREHSYRCCEGVPLRWPCATGTCHGTLARPVGPALCRERVELVRAREWTRSAQLSAARG